MLFNEIKCHVNTSLGLVGRMHPQHPPCVRAWFLPTAIQWRVGTSARLIGSAFAFLQVNPLRACYLRTHQISRGFTKIFARDCYPRTNNVSHVVVERTMWHA